MQELEPGEDACFTEPADVGGNYEAFERQTLLRIGAGLGLLYDLLTGDLSRNNYSSIRAGILSFRRLTYGLVELDPIVARSGCENRPLLLHNLVAGEFSGNAANEATLRLKVSCQVQTLAYIRFSLALAQVPTRCETRYSAASG